jgi:hypothetical protein
LARGLSGKRVDANLDGIRIIGRVGLFMLRS